MAKLLVLYNKPADPAAFDKHYLETHVPLARKIPGVRSYEINRGAVMTPGGAANYHLVALLTFDSMEALKAGLAAPEGAAAAADLKNFAQAGVTMLMFDTQEV